MAPTITDTLSDILAEAYSETPVKSAESITTLPHSSVYRVHFMNGDTVFVKHASSADFPTSLRKEIVVNRDILSTFPQKVAPRCFAQCADTEYPWMILEDISTTHRPLTQRVPTGSDIEKFVAVLAKSHAQSRKIDLTGAFAPLRSNTCVTDGSDQAAPMLDAFLHENDGAEFPAQSFDLVKKLRDHVRQLGPLLAGHLVLVHGDAHFWNALYGNDALLLDWEMAVIGPGEVDLCHALAMNLPRDVAKRHETACLSHYVRTCSEFGVELSERDVWERYRMCLLLTVLVSIGMRRIPGIGDKVWRNMFTNAVEAAIDHNSVSFLG